MAKEIKQPVLQPEFELTRPELAKLIEHVAGRKPKPGFKSVRLTQGFDGETARLAWVDIEGADPVKTGAKANAEKPTGS